MSAGYFLSHIIYYAAYCTYTVYKTTVQCYHSVIVITFETARSDPNKLRSQYYYHYNILIEKMSCIGITKKSLFICVNVCDGHVSISVLCICKINKSF